MNFQDHERRWKPLCRWLGVVTLALLAIFGAGLWSLQRGRLHLTYRIVDLDTGGLVPNVSAAITRARQPRFPLSTVLRLFPSLQPMIKPLQTKNMVGKDGTIDAAFAAESLSEYTLIFAAPGYHPTEFIYNKGDDTYRFRSHDPALRNTFLLWSTNVITLPLRQKRNRHPWSTLPIIDVPVSRPRLFYLSPGSLDP